MSGLDVASGVAGLIALALQVSHSLTEYITAVKDKSKNVQELLEELNLLGEALSLLNDFIFEEELKGRLLDDASLFARAVRDCKRRIERIGKSLTPPEGKLGRAWDRFIWPFEQKEIIKLVQNLRRFTSIFHFAANTQGFRMISRATEESSQKLQDALQKLDALRQDNEARGLAVENVAKKMSRIEEILSLIPLLESTAAEVQEISQSVRLAEQEAMKQRKSRILDWLCPKEAFHKHAYIQQNRTAGTGKWFLQSPDFVLWVQNLSQGRDLLCVGGPGVGKSFLSSMVIDHLLERYQGGDTAVAYFYCDYKEGQQQNASQFAACLLRQLCRPHVAIPAPVAEFYERTRDDFKDQTWFQGVLQVLHLVASTFPFKFVVVDALDELEGGLMRDGIFHVLDTIRAASGISKIFATTRPHLNNLETHFCDVLKIEILADAQDIRTHLEKLIDQSHIASAFMDATLKQEILNQLCDSASGMFLLPTLQVNSLLNHVTKAGVRKAIQQLAHSAPDSAAKKLEEVYASSLKRIQDLPTERRKIALNTLMWVSRARRALKIEELQHALAVEPGDRELDRDNIVPMSTILDSCCGLVELESNSRIIQFPHFSLAEYLRGESHDLFENADLQICRTLMQYILFDPIQCLASQNRKSFLDAIATYPLLDYACDEWGHHARGVSVGTIEDLVLPLLTSIPNLLVMARVRNRDSQYLRKVLDRMRAWASSGGAGISLAATFGLTEVIRMLIDRTEIPVLKAKNIWGGTPLHEAAIFGYVDTAELLIVNEADLLATNLGQNTPIYLAVSARQAEMVKYLLCWGTSQLTKSAREGWTCLHKAADLGDQEIVALLLQSCNAQVENNMGATPLHLAAQRGHLGICKSLIQAGADVHARTRPLDQTPLYLAAMEGHVEVLRCLVDAGAKINSSSRGGWTPLHGAARRGHTEAISFLISRGANLMAEEKKCNLPIHFAARSGNLAAVSVLLSARGKLRPEQIFHKDKLGSTPREVAFYCAHYQIYKYLRDVEREYLPMSPSSIAEHAINNAIERGDIQTVKTLIQTDSNVVHAPDADGQPPLHIAILENQEEIARLLLDFGASIESIGYHDWRPLQIAASLGNLPLVKLCLAYNASPHTISRSGQTPLHKACSGHNVEVVRTLIEAKADPWAMNDRRMTCLHVAAHQGDINNVRYLVMEVGMSVLTRDKVGFTAVDWAESGGRLECKRFLSQRARVERQEMKTKGKIRHNSYEGWQTGNEQPFGAETGWQENEEEMEDFEILEEARATFEEMVIEEAV